MTKNEKLITDAEMVQAVRKDIGADKMNYIPEICKMLGVGGV
jgi:glutamine phosphoribosylpyrophosphate amidotransferase